MSDLALFSAPKPFTDPHIAVIQHNAIDSWVRLGGETYLVGAEAGLTEAAAAHEVELLGPVERNAAGTPLVSSIFDLARRRSAAPYLGYVNGDILLLPDLLDAVSAMQHALGQQPFLLIGRRYDLDVTNRLDFSGDWPARLRQDVSERGRLHKPAGSDYFIFPRQAFVDMPAFAIGRAGWDNWMIYHARAQGWPVVDGTPDVMIVHQNHDYRHPPGGRPHYDQDESRVNMALAGGLAHMYMLLDSSHELRQGRLQPAGVTFLRILRAAERHLTPANGKLRGGRGSLARSFRRLRRRWSE
jgi:hypothetical protein